MSCDRCGRDACVDGDGRVKYGYVFGLCVVCDDWLKEQSERRTGDADCATGAQETL